MVASYKTVLILDIAHFRPQIERETNNNAQWEYLIVFLHVQPSLFL